MTFKSKLILSITTVQLGLLVLLSFGGMQLTDYVATNTLQSKANDVSKFLQPVGVVGVQKNNMEWFERTSKLVLLSEDIDAVKLLDVGGKVLVDERTLSTPPISGFVFRKNLVKLGIIYGQLIINISHNVEKAAHVDAQLFVIFIGISTGLSMLMLGALIGNIMLRKHELNYIEEFEGQDIIEIEVSDSYFDSHPLARPQTSAKMHRRTRPQLHTDPVRRPELESKLEAHLESHAEHQVEPQFIPATESLEPPRQIQPSIDFVSADEELVEFEPNDMVQAPSHFPEIIEKSLDAVVLTDLEGDIIGFNPAAEKLFGYRRDVIHGNNFSELLLVKKTEDPYLDFLASINNEDGGEVEGVYESKFCSDEGRVIDLNVHLTTITSDNEKQIVLYTRDVSQQKATENQLNYLAFYDELTGLPNLSLLSDHIRKAIFEASANNQQIVVLKVGLDRFKHINESLGHRFGDYLIRSIATRLKDKISNGDMVSRINGDQFVVVLVNVKQDSHVNVLVQDYLDIFQSSFQVESKNIHVNVSIGATIFPGEEKTVEGLLRNAESAMFRAKDIGGNNFQFFSQEMRKISQERLYMETELRKALELDQFELHYQPQVDIKERKIIGVEALIRWNHPELGLVPPMKFIPLAEEIGLIIPIGEWVLRTACLLNKQFMDEREEPLILAVNLSARQFKNYDLVGRIASILQETEYPAELLELEITESLLMENMEDVASILDVLSDQGIRISMDDFGTGYSSLSYLKSFPINTLKIDRSFVQDLEEDNNNACIVTATIQMAHSLEIDIVAEGVETEGQLRILADKDCDKIQGYYFSRPLVAKDLRVFLDENRTLDLQEDSPKLISNV